MAKFKTPHKGNKPQSKKKKKMVPGWGGSLEEHSSNAKSFHKRWTSLQSVSHGQKLSNAINTEYKAYDATSIAGAVDYNGGVSSPQH